ncbi:MAG: hypothetical protein JSU74_13695 [Candidatus Zixiibacteriota bacterium]|nr:MAG: hypothetical protein JSU74_13695 [candidate division Zixibacteria bacterium]
MSESTRKKIIAAVMVVVIIWGYNNLKPSDGPTKKPVRTKETAVSVQPPAPPPQSPSAPKLVNVEQQAKEPWGADPFRVKSRSGKKDGKARKKPRWQLSGILHNAQAPIAIINKRQVKTGQTINDAKVVKIDKRTVTIEHNGKRMTLTVTKG